MRGMYRSAERLEDAEGAGQVRDFESIDSQRPCHREQGGSRARSLTCGRDNYARPTLNDMIWKEVSTHEQSPFTFPLSHRFGPARWSRSR